MRLLIGGSPCTHWSIAQTKNRETQPEGIGWELFENYLIAKAKFHPDYFLYENNKSMATPIREQITRELGVEPVLINSALVSAQNRQRLYWTNIPGIEQPEDRGIILRDILETGLPLQDKSYTLKANYSKASAANAVDDGHFPAPMAAEPVNVTGDGKAQCLRASYYKDGIRNMVLVGVGLLLYPTVSDWWNQRHMSHAIAGYTEAVEGMSAEDYARYRDAAQEYNEYLKTCVGRFTPSEEESEWYRSLLNVTSDGNW